MMGMMGMIMGHMISSARFKRFKRSELNNERMKQFQSNFVNISNEARDIILEHRKRNNIVPMTNGEIHLKANQIMEDRLKEHKQYLINMSDEDRIAYQKVKPMTNEEIHLKANQIMEKRGKELSQQLEDYAKELQNDNMKN